MAGERTVDAGLVGLRRTAKIPIGISDCSFDGAAVDKGEVLVVSQRGSQKVRDFGPRLVIAPWPSQREGLAEPVQQVLGIAQQFVIADENTGLSRVCASACV